MGFQDVAFLLADQQITHDDQVKREDLEEWQPAHSVIGLLRAAEKHTGEEERVVIVEDAEEVPQLTVAERRSLEIDEVIRKTRANLMNEPTVESSERTYVEMFAVWGPVSLLVAAVGYAAWSHLTYDKFKNKKFESTPPPPVVSEVGL